MEGDEGYWLSVTELARLRGVDKAAISRRAKRYEEQGLLKPKPGKGGVKMINVAEFDRAAGMATDAVRELNGTGGGAAATSTAALPGDPVLAREQARRASYDADLKKLELQERLGELVPVEAVREAIIAMAENFVRGLDQLPARAEECVAESAKGLAAARAFLRGLGNGVREALERDLKGLVFAAKPSDAEPP